MYGCDRRRLRFPRHLPDSVPSYWEHLPPHDARLEPILNRIATLRITGLSTEGVIYDFLSTNLAPLRQRSRPAWLYSDFNDESRTRQGANSGLPLPALQRAYKVLTGLDFPDGFEYPPGAGPLRLVEKKYQIINWLPKMNERGVLLVLTRPVGGPTVAPTCLPHCCTRGGPSRESSGYRSRR